MLHSTVGIPPLSVATMLTPAERLRVDAAGEGSYHTVHRDTVAEMIQDLKQNRATAILLSVSRCDSEARAGVATLVREFPRVPTVALLTQNDHSTPRAMLSLGSTGVAQLVDVRDAKGWGELRNYLVAAHGEDIKRLSLGQLTMDLADAPTDCWRFFEALFLPINQARTVRALARHLEVSSSTLMSRFFRARLPAPKRYLSTARLIRAAQVLENPGLSIANAANQLDCSSPQAFGRHVRMLMKLTPVEFRRRYDGFGMLEYFRQTLVLPYLEQLRTFHPISPPLVASQGSYLIH
ncbi:MAG: helix-turn-helix domain-containing protein [Gemmatimonadaceae bacterium]